MNNLKDSKKVDGEIKHHHIANEVVFERFFNVSNEKIWQFINQPDNLVKWFGGKMEEWKLSDDNGKFTLNIAPHWNTRVYGKILEYEPLRILRFTWDVPAWGHSPNLFGTTISISTKVVEGGVKIKFSHTLPYEAGREALLAGAWHLHLDQLGELLKGNDENYRIDSNQLFELSKDYLEKDYNEKLNGLKTMLGVE